MENKKHTYNIGEICPESGVYQLVGCTCNKKGNCEVSQEEYTIPLVKGKTFPPCKHCSHNKWALVRKA